MEVRPNTATTPPAVAKDPVDCWTVNRTESGSRPYERRPTRAAPKVGAAYGSAKPARQLPASEVLDKMLLLRLSDRANNAASDQWLNSANRGSPGAVRGNGSS